MRETGEKMGAIVIALLCILSVANSSTIGRQYNEDLSTVCPGPCNCTSYTATCRSLNFDRSQFPSQISGLKLISPLEPLELSHRAFANLGMGSLVSLVISDATITQLNQTAFEGIPSLKTVAILNSVVPPIHEETFANSKLTMLDLTGTALSVFHPIVSQTLEELILVNCKLNRITGDMFQQLPSLNFINLARNNIEEIDVNAFGEQEDLEELVLHHNNLKNISFNLFSKNMFIATLDLSHNPISKVNFNEELELEKLIMNSCLLTEFIGGPSSLSYLDLRNNGIKSFDVGNMYDLQFLYLAHNKIENIEANAFENNTALLTLILDHNPIGNINPFINVKEETYMLKNLSYRNCGIEKLNPLTFETLTSLDSLDLSNNKLVDLDENVFAPLTGLRVLKLAKNKIKQIPTNVLSQNSLLRKLDLSENEIVSLEVQAFQHNTNLELLDLSYGRFEKLWREPSNIKLKITAINAASNPLKELTLKELRVTPFLEVLDIDNVLVPCIQITDLLPYLKANKIAPTIYKTHEDTADASLDDYDDNHYKSWDEYIKSKGCEALEEEEDIVVEDNLDEIEEDPNEIEEDIDEEIEDEFDDAYNNIKDTTEDPWIDDKDNDEDMAPINEDDRVPLDYDISILRAMEHDRFAASSYNRFAFLWPTLVFLFTCLLVLMVAVNVILLILRKRGALSRNVPQLKTSWGNSNRLLTKRHCGSIYRPLTEDLSGSKTPIISRSLLFTHHTNAGNDTPAVHNV